MQLGLKHHQAIEAAIQDIRAIEARDGVTRDSLSAIQQRLMVLAARVDLFTLETCPPPAPGTQPSNYLYRLHEDDDHRFALYANATTGGVRTPVHNHTTWAVIAGVSGEELNKVYARNPAGGVTETSRKLVAPGSGIAFMPDDLHAIEIDKPLLNFHLYGLGLDQLDRREYYKTDEQRWLVFDQFVQHIREARAGHQQ
jgi:predicted metal-dependent enzyme (double-stranded beta helix superfamily)